VCIFCWLCVLYFLTCVNRDLTAAAVVMVCFCHAVTLLRILECVGYMSISSDDLKHILRLLKVEEDEPVVRSCVVSGYK